MTAPITPNPASGSTSKAKGLFIPKAAGALSLASCLYDIHKSAVISSNNNYARVSSSMVIRDSIGSQKTNHLSWKDSKRKEWLANSQFFYSTRELFARIGGYIKGFVKATVRYIPKIVLAGVAIFAGKGMNEKVANFATIGLGIAEAWDFIKNSTNITQRTDYIK